MPAAVVPAPSPVPSHESDKDAEDREYKAAQYRLNRLLTWFNGLLAIFTLALVGVGAWQAWRLRQAVEASKEAADATARSADFAQRAFYTTNRPWVLVTGFHIELTESGKLRVTYKAYNAGDLPAVFRGGESVGYVGEELPQSLEFTGHYPPAYVLAPNGNEKQGFVPVSSEPILRSADQSSVINGEIKIFYVGHLDYEGPFKGPNGQTILYKTGFGAWYKGPISQRTNMTEKEARLVNAPVVTPIPMQVVADSRYNYLV